jgi:hypothetical protein
MTNYKELQNTLHQILVEPLAWFIRCVGHKARNLTMRETIKPSERLLELESSIVIPDAVSNKIAPTTTKVTAAGLRRYLIPIATSDSEGTRANSPIILKI